jgi:hypothetical protein
VLEIVYNTPHSFSSIFAMRKGSSASIAGATKRGAKNGMGKDRYIYGIAYNEVLDVDSNNTKNVMLSPESLNVLNNKNKNSKETRKVLYHDPAVRLTTTDIKNVNLYGYPIYCEHETNKRVGEIIDCWLTSSVSATGGGGGGGGGPNAFPSGKKDMVVVAHIWDKEAVDMVDSGTLGSFSVGYDYLFSFGGKVQDKQMNEISLCREPFFEGCRIQVKASDNDSRGAVGPQKKMMQTTNGFFKIKTIKGMFFLIENSFYE